MTYVEDLLVHHAVVDVVVLVVGVRTVGSVRENLALNVEADVDLGVEAAGLGVEVDLDVEASGLDVGVTGVGMVVVTYENTKSRVFVNFAVLREEPPGVLIP